MVQKQSILEEYERSISWVRSLENLTEDQWRMPIAPGKWTVAEVIGHLIYWDRFVLEQRLPYFFDGHPLPPSPDVELMNGRASEEAKKRSKNATISLFAGTRDKLMRELKDIPAADWSRELSAFGKSMTLTGYLSGLLAHDGNHFAEIGHAMGIEPF